ncbi:MAG TPA: type II toxin-antitoxin system VapC family toxin [Anaerolineaceae bacterium]|nr:type II toxin-antitoxin system VapC family toxin [Anaerolineaceae bacterium]HNS37793.1 type II toxin-antitoxin system VapC family toxin [Anaerolineaceae bacterium]
MNYLLDTCVLSEFTRRQPDSRVVDWLNAIAEDRLFISVITVGEIQHGIERLPDSHRKTELLVWMNTALLERFAGRMVTIDAPTMHQWGSLTARMEALGQPLGLMDSLIIASALQHNLIVATRNVADFLPGGVQVINPWE